MTKAEFIEQLQEELEYETPLAPDTMIRELDEWDSMSAMVLIGFVSQKFGVTLKGDDIREITTIDSLIARIGAEKFNG